MSIRKRKWANGKEAWQVDLLVRRVRSRAQFPTKAEAKAYELATRSKISTGTFRPASAKMTIAQVVPEYVTHLEERHKSGKRMVQATLVTKTSQIRNFIIGGVEFISPSHPPTVFEHGIGDFKLADLTSDDVEAFIDQVLALGRSLKTARDIRIVLVGLLDFAKRKRYVGTNVARDFKLIGGDNAISKKKIIPPSKELGSGLTT